MVYLTQTTVHLARYKMLYILFVLGLWSRACWAGYTSTYQMENMCGKELSFLWKDLDQTRVEYEYKPYLKSESCTYTVEARYTWSRLMFYFQEMDFDCSQGSLSVTDGETADEKIAGLSSNICGTKPTGIYKSDSRHVKLQFNPSNTGANVQKTYFKIMFTSFHLGGCKSYEYECDNNRCIDDDIACNGLNPCGDNSDCRMGGWVIAGIVIGCIVVLGGILFVIFLVYMCKRKRPVQNPWSATPMTTQQQQQQQQQPLTTTTGAVYPPAPYPQVAVQYPQYPQTAGQYPQPFVQYQQAGGQYPQPTTAQGYYSAESSAPNVPPQTSGGS